MAAVNMLLKFSAFFQSVSLAFLTVTNEKTRAVTEYTADNYVFDENGTPSGICIDLWKLVANELGIDYELTVTSPMQSVVAFEDKTADIIIGKMDDIQMDRMDNFE